MVELQLPKLITWVRFPSPAPNRCWGQMLGSESSARVVTLALDSDPNYPLALDSDPNYHSGT